MTASRLTRSIREEFRDVKFLLRSGGSLKIVGRYMFYRRVRRKFEKRYKAETALFRAFAKDKLQTSNLWFLGHVPIWLWIFEKHGLARRPHLSALEIGSWEGVSASFLLNRLPNAHLTCVDTWQGSDEHDKAGMASVEQRFDSNVAAFAGRLTKFRGTSYAYFNQKPEDAEFDFIYVDGSHLADDVIIDAVKCFSALKPGGMIVFDDYVWNHYPDVNDNPANAIHRFLELKRGKLQILYLFRQVIVRRI